MKERGIIIPIGGGIHFRIDYWRCWTGHKWVYSFGGRKTCAKCHIRMTHEIVNGGMNKAWVWRMPKSN